MHQTARARNPVSVTAPVLGIPRGSLVALVGPAGAGKTTFARAHFRSTEILSSDAFRAMLADDETNQRVNRVAFELLHLAVAGRLAGGRLTVVDATNVTHDARRALVDLARAARCPAVAIVFDLPEGECQARNRRRPGRAVDAAVVARQADELRQTLDRNGLTAEGFHAIYILRTADEIDATRTELVGMRQPRRLGSREGDARHPSIRAASSLAQRRSCVDDVRMRPTPPVADPGTNPIGPRTARTRIRRHPERAVPERIEEILRTGLVAHVAYIVEGEPRVIPLLYGYEPGRIILHGAPGSSTLGHLRSGARVAISVTNLEALVASRDAETHSANYESAVAYGTTRRIARGEEKRRLLEAMTRRYFPGRTLGRDYAAATEEQVRALEVIEVRVEEAAGKARSGGPLGPRDGDSDAPGSAGIYPLSGIAPD